LRVLKRASWDSLRCLEWHSSQRLRIAATAARPPCLQVCQQVVSVDAAPGGGYNWSLFWPNFWNCDPSQHLEAGDVGGCTCAHHHTRAIAQPMEPRPLGMWQHAQDCPYTAQRWGWHASRHNRSCRRRWQQRYLWTPHRQSLHRRSSCGTQRSLHTCCDARKLDSMASVPSF
jgi:hypothetical protein